MYIPNVYVLVSSSMLVPGTKHGQSGHPTIMTGIAGQALKNQALSKWRGITFPLSGKVYQNPCSTQTISNTPT